MRFVAEETAVSNGVRRRRFDVERDGHVVPGILWTPKDAAGPCPLVLVGHGASASKNEVYVAALAKYLVREHQFAAAAIDGPIHGDRRADKGAAPEVVWLEFGRIWGEDPKLHDDMVADWRACLDALAKLPEVGDGPVGYWGLSMGTILGLPFVATEPRISAAVLGLMGVSGPTKTRLVADAGEVRCPVLFLMQWDDELFARDKVLALFDAIATPDKRLHANPGSHGAVPPDEFIATAEFLAERLRADVPTA